MCNEGIRLISIYRCCKPLLKSNRIYFQCRKVIFEIIILSCKLASFATMYFRMCFKKFVIFRWCVWYLQLSKISKVRKLLRQNDSWDRHLWHNRMARMRWKKFVHMGWWNITETITAEIGTKSVLPWHYLEISRHFKWLYQALPSMNWFPLLNSPHALYQHYRRSDKNSFCGVFAALFYNLLILNVYPGMKVRLMIFSTINARDLIMQNEKFHIYTLKLNTIFGIAKKSN